MFLGFLSAPTMFALNDKELNTIILTEEEEHETHSSNTKIAEEELQAINLSQILYFLSDFLIFHNHNTSHSVSYDLVIKIPSPPPEFC